MQISNLLNSPTALRVVSIDTLPAKEQGFDLHLESPIIDETRSSHTLLLVGEISGSRSVLLQMQVYFHCFLLHRAVLQAVPSDETCESPQKYRFRMGFSTLGLDEDACLDVRVRCEGPTILPLGKIHINRKRFSPRSHPKLQPCFVTGLGRSGTTQLMKLISAHPAIRAQTEYPMETRMAQHFMQLFHVSSSPAIHRKDYNVDNFFNFTSNSFYGPSPYYQTPYSRNSKTEKWFERQYLPRLERMVFDSIDHFYGTMKGRWWLPGAGRPRYFLEKTHPTLMPFLFHEVYRGTKEIFLVRDFRDTYASMLGFNEKRQSQDFGRANATSDLEFLRHLGNSVQQLSTSWTLRREKAHLVHYEDLCREEENVMRGIFEFLELSPSAGLKNSGKTKPEPDSQLDTHRTSESAEGSIGKWKTVLPPELAEACNQAFREPLKIFGYE